MQNKLARDTKRAFGRLSVRVKHPGQPWQNLGVVSERMITDAFIALLVSVMTGGAATALQNLKYHGTGSGNTAESASDTTLETPVGARVIGTQESTGPGNYRTVASVSYSGAENIREHGIFSAAVGGTLLDRSVFVAIPVVNGTLVQYTYDLTISGT